LEIWSPGGVNFLFWKIDGWGNGKISLRIQTMEKKLIFCGISPIIGNDFTD